MDFPTFQDGMFPKCKHLILCRAQIFPIPGPFCVDRERGLCYDGCVGVDFSALFFCCLDADCKEQLRPSGALWQVWILQSRSSWATAGSPRMTGSRACTNPPKWNDPRPSSGVISFPWVRSLVNLAFCWIDRAFVFGWNPFRSIHVLQLTIAIGIYVKRKMGKPVGKSAYHIWYHLFSYHQSTTFQAFLQDGISHKLLRWFWYKTENLRNSACQMLTSILRYAMMMVLGRSAGGASFFLCPGSGAKEMTLGDSVNNRQGSFPFILGI